MIVSINFEEHFIDAPFEAPCLCHVEAKLCEMYGWPTEPVEHTDHLKCHHLLRIYVYALSQLTDILIQQNRLEEDFDYLLKINLETLECKMTLEGFKPGNFFYGPDKPLPVDEQFKDEFIDSSCPGFQLKFLH